MELLNKLSDKFTEGQAKLIMLRSYSESIENGQISDWHRQSVFKSMERTCNQLEQVVKEINELMDCRPCSIIMVNREDSVTIAEEVLL